MKVDHPTHELYWHRDFVIIVTRVWNKNEIGNKVCTRYRAKLTLKDFEELYVEKSCTLKICISRTSLAQPPTLEQIVSKYPGTRILILCSNFQEGYSSLIMCQQLEEVILRSHAQTSLKGFEFLSSLRKVSVSRGTQKGCYGEDAFDPSEPFCLDHLDGTPLEHLSIGGMERPVRGGGISLPHLKCLELKLVPGFVEPFPGIWIPDSCRVEVNGRDLEKMRKRLPENFLGILPSS